MTNWALDVAEKIKRLAREHEDLHIDVADILPIIAKHCPFKPDVAYMPVPRCETCRYMDPRVSLPLCLKLNLAVTRDFGCVQWEMKT